VVEGKKKAAELLLQDGDAPAAAAAAAASSGTVSTLESTSSTLYVKNLSFSTTEASLQSLFSSVAPVRAVSISRKKNTKARPGTNDPAFLSLGFGFVEYRTAAEATKALQQLQGAELDNHKLDIKVSSRGASSSSAAPAAAAAGSSSAAAASAAAPAGAAGIPSSKLLVKNVPFETTARELRDLFAAFGTIQRIRLPKKFGQLGHRGFAFVDFVTKSEAAHALEQVKHSHLYGRHLVIEYAAPTSGEASADPADVDSLRAKTAAKYAAAQTGGPPNKKRRTAGADADADDIDAAFSSKFT
jgi:multiple RNA-binding domain-containing protein 1